MERESITDSRAEGKAIIRHYVIGGHPGEAAIKSAGVSSQVEYYQQVLETIKGWSGLSVDEIESAIQVAPDTIENSDSPNYKPLYLEALGNIRNLQKP